MMLHILIAMMFVFGGVTDERDDFLSWRKASMVEFEMNHFAQAETLAHKALRSAEKMKDDYAIAVSHSALGDILHAQSRFADAEHVYGKAISIFNRKPRQHHALAVVWRNLGVNLTAQTRFDEASSALKLAAKFLSRSRVQDPQLRALILNGSGVAHFYQGNMNKAEASFLRAAESQVRAVRARDLDLGDVLNNLARVYQTKRQYAKAEDAYNRSLHLMTTRLGSTHPGLTAPLDNVGSLYTEMGRYKEAEAALQRSLTIQEQAGASVDETALMHTLYELGKTYVSQNDRARAEPILARASELARKRVLIRDMPEAVAILEAYSAVLRDRSNLIAAQRLSAEARRIRATLAFTVPLANAK